MLTLKSCNDCLQGMNNGNIANNIFLKHFSKTAGRVTSYKLQITKLDLGSSRTSVDLRSLPNDQPNIG